MFSSWSLQSPNLLLALLSLLIPLAIHLFSKSKGKLVPIGNIKFIQTGKPVRMREIRLVDRLLLLCRLLVLFFSVLLLANLFFYGQLNLPNNVVIITADWLNNSNKNEKRQLIENERGSDYYLLSNNISANISKNSSAKTSQKLSKDPSLSNKSLSKQDILLWQPENIDSLNSRPLPTTRKNTWALVANFEKTLAEKTTLTVYSTNRVAEFSGNKVKFSRNVNWQIKVLANNPTPAFQELKQVRLSIAVISDDDRKEDVSYIKAALDILKSEKLKNLKLTYFDDVSSYQSFYKNEATQWIFYLSSMAVPESILKQVKLGSQLLLDAKVIDAQEGDTKKTKTSSKHLWEVQIAEHNLSIIKGFLYGNTVLERINLLDESLVIDVLWKAAAVNNKVKKDLLIEHSQGLGKIIAFNSRFNPKWNDLVIQPQFPHFILSLFLSEKLAELEQQHGRLTLEQIGTEQISTVDSKKQSQDSFSNEGNKRPFKEKSQSMSKSWLNKILMVLLVLFFSIERILSEIKIAKKVRSLQDSNAGSL